MPSDEPDFGPPGYLPPRAAKRARKIILREPLGLAWAVGAVVAGTIVLVAGVVLLGRFGPPEAPFVPAGPIDAIDPRGAGIVTLRDGTDVLVLRGAGGVTAFAAPSDGQTVRWCPDSGRLEAPDGRVWEPDGRLVGGTGTSLVRVPSAVHDGAIFVDPTTPAEPRPPADRDEALRCVG